MVWVGVGVSPMSAPASPVCRGAVSAGIGVSLLPKRLMPADQLALTQWPKVASVELALHAGGSGSGPLSRLSSALIALCDEVMGQQ